MAEFMKYNTGMALLNSFLLADIRRVKYASRARSQYYKHVTFGSCPDETFKTISNCVDKLIKKDKS